MIPHKTQDLLTSYILTTEDVPPWLYFGRTPTKEKRMVFLSRIYLCHLATGGLCYDVEDLILVEMLLASWEQTMREVTT